MRVRCTNSVTQLGQFLSLARQRCSQWPHWRCFGCELPSFFMRAGLDVDTLFRIEDAASARLMLVKASCLRKAGVIDEAEAAAIFRRANAILFPFESSHAA